RETSEKFKLLFQSYN
nr:Chain B, Nuclear receptor coactivator 4 [Homo sapiens]